MPINAVTHPTGISLGESRVLETKSAAIIIIPPIIAERKTTYLCFDENTEVIFEAKSHEDFSDVEASVPSLTVQTNKTNKITNRSKIEVNNTFYGVIKKDNKKDGTTIIYLELEDA